MKMLKKLLTLVLTVALTLSCMGEVKASDVSKKEAYTYTVTLYAGNRGKLTADVFEVVSNNEVSYDISADKVVISGLAAGDAISFYPQVGVTNVEDKYYVQGIRLSGRDNDEGKETFFNVSKDADYVVAYGIKGNQVAYTVNYVDADGNELAPSDTFYGNIGDKPVVAYKYIDGYVPEVLGFTKTLAEDASENVFTFVYDEAPTPSIIVDYITGGGTSNVNGQGGQDGTGQAGNDDAQAGDNQDGQGGQGGQDNQGNDDQQGGEDQNGPIQDLDDEQTPGGNIDVDGSNLGMVGGIAIAVAAAVALFILILAMMKKRKEQ